MVKLERSSSSGKRKGKGKSFLSSGRPAAEQLSQMVRSNHQIRYIYVFLCIFKAWLLSSLALYHIAYRHHSAPLSIIHPVLPYKLGPGESETQQTTIRIRATQMHNGCRRMRNSSNLFFSKLQVLENRAEK